MNVSRFLLAMLTLCAIPAFAQYGPAGNPSNSAGIGFQPLAKTSWVAASGTSASIAIANPTSSSKQVQVYNSTAQAAFVIACLTSSCTASVGSAGTSTTDYPVAPGAVIVMTIPTNSTYVAVILTSGTGAVYFSYGVGL
jgi:hypothetical protein